MSKSINDFCDYCTGNKAKEVHECTDINCPFHPFRFGGLEPEVEADLVKKLLKK